MTPKTNKHHRPDFLNGLALGSLIGAAAYYLYLTEDGKKTKQKLIKKSELFLKDLEEAIDEAKKETTKVVKKVHQKKQTKDKKKQIKSKQEEKLKSKVKAGSQPEKELKSNRKLVKPGPKKKIKKSFSKKGKKLT